MLTAFPVNQLLHHMEQDHFTRKTGCPYSQIPLPAFSGSTMPADSAIFQRSPRNSIKIYEGYHIDSFYLLLRAL